MSKQDIERMVELLCELGEDKEELNLWVTIYNDLEPEEQLNLEINLREELGKLEKLKKLA